MRKYEVKLTGISPMLMHHDNIDWADRMTEWKDDPANKSKSKAGDDRTPAFRWIGCLYHDPKTGKVALPQDMIMSCLMKAGAMVPVPGGKSGKTFKAQTQSGMMLGNDFWSFECAGSEIGMNEIQPLMEETKFNKHRTVCQELGFSLMVKRAAIGSSKHVRVRPRFDTWSANGEIVVWDDQLTHDALTSIFHYAGRYKGIGDWRPGGKTPGPYGMFEAAITEM